MPTGGASTLGVNRYRYLLASLLVLIVLEPWLRGTGGRVLLIAVFSAILLSAVWGLHTSRRGFALGLTLALVALAGNWIGAFVESLPLLFASRAVTVVFLGLVIWTLLGNVARQTRIQPDTIYQAACVYLILGVIFALVYASLSLIDSGAFNPIPTAAAVPGGPAVSAPEPAMAKWIYFSFITLTTVGYGDITPIAPAARSLVILEALIGQFFVAVLVARLVGLLQTQLASGD
jgi:voltage-gated potassium channel